MKTLTIILFCCIFGISKLSAQNDTKENSYGINILPVSTSEAYSLGIGFYLAKDFSKDGKGFGILLSSSYLIPTKTYNDILLEGYEAELALKYDIPIQSFLEVYPSIGGGGISNKFNYGDSNTEFYFIAGGGATLSISQTIKLGVDVFKPFLENANVAVISNLRFNF